MLIQTLKQLQSEEIKKAIGIVINSALFSNPPVTKQSLLEIGGAFLIMLDGHITQLSQETISNIRQKTNPLNNNAESRQLSAILTGKFLGETTQPPGTTTREYHTKRMVEQMLASEESRSQENNDHNDQHIKTTFENFLKSISPILPNNENLIPQTLKCIEIFTKAADYLGDKTEFFEKYDEWANSIEHALNSKKPPSMLQINQLYLKIFEFSDKIAKYLLQKDQEYMNKKYGPNMQSSFFANQDKTSNATINPLDSDGQPTDQFAFYDKNPKH